MTTPIWNCCCSCNRKLENYANTTDLNSWFHSFPSDSPYYGCYVDGTPQPPRTAGDVTCSECTGSCFCGAWPIPYPNQYFTDQNTQSTFNVCTPGYRGAIARRIWNGRYGFTDDYVANPKLLVKYLGYNVALTYAESYSGKIVNYNPDGTVNYVSSGSGQNNLSASSNNDVVHWGVLQGAGTTTVGGGSGSWDDHGFIYDYFYPESATGGAGFYPILIPTIPPPPFDPTPALANYTMLAQKWCGLNNDIATLYISTPWGDYIGPDSGFAAWLSKLNVNTDTVSVANGNWNHTKISRQYTIQNFQITPTKIHITIQLKASYYEEGWADDGHGNPTLPHSGTIDFTDFTAVFDITANLTQPQNFYDVEADAQYLLNYWDMANDSLWDYSWMTGNCQILPMVSRREIGATAPTSGYQEAPTDPGEVANLNANLAFYDGSVVGAPLSSYQDPGNPGHDYPNGYYNPGWFDFGCLIYHYNEPIGDGDNFKLCYGYGSYMPSGMPSQATQFPDGATDTCYLGEGWSPFSRFKISYVLNQMPPFVLGGGAYVSGTNGADVYASKYAEVKMPLASQNFCAPTSVQPNQAAVDNFAGWPAPNMKDLNVLDATTCADTGVKRYPDATDTPDPYWFDIRPKGDFVMAFFNTALSMSQDGGGNWIQNYTTTPSAIERNIQPGDKKYAIIAICPPYSPELTSSNWQGGNVFFWTDYPQVQPLESWRATIQQAMTDRFWIDAQDNQEQQNLNEDKVDGDGNPLPPDLECVSLKLTTPLVEARLTAPRGAPLQFATASPNRWLAMPTAADFGIACTGVWNYGYAPQPFSKPFGFQSATVTDNAGSNLGAGDSGGGL